MMILLIEEFLVDEWQQGMHIAEVYLEKYDLVFS